MPYKNTMLRHSKVLITQSDLQTLEIISHVTIPTVSSNMEAVHSSVTGSLSSIQAIFVFFFLNCSVCLPTAAS